MTTFLEGVQDVVRLAGISSSTLPTAVTGQTGRLLKAVKYYQQANEEIENLHFDWNFLWSTNTITTTASTATYAGEADLGLWDVNRVYYSGSALDVIRWQQYTPEDLSNGPPQYAVVQPDNKLLIVPTPDAAYTITYDYFKKPVALVNDADEPLIPEQYRLVIVGRALMLFANYESAEEIKIQGQELYEQYLSRLEAHELPRKAQMQGRHEAIDLTVVTE